MLLRNIGRLSPDYTASQCVPQDELGSPVRWDGPAADATGAVGAHGLTAASLSAGAPPEEADSPTPSPVFPNPVKFDR
jgi:hypothetical protein